MTNFFKCVKVLVLIVEILPETRIAFVPVPSRLFLIPRLEEFPTMKMQTAKCM